MSDIDKIKADVAEVHRLYGICDDPIWDGPTMADDYLRCATQLDEARCLLADAFRVMTTGNDDDWETADKVKAFLGGGK